MTDKSDEGTVADDQLDTLSKFLGESSTLSNETVKPPKKSAPKKSTSKKSAPKKSAPKKSASIKPSPNLTPHAKIQAKIKARK